MQDLSNLDYRPCVGIMVINESRHIFSGQRFDFSSRAWQMPQGGIEKEEDPSDAAFRELEEETSIGRDKVHLLAVSKNWLRYDLPIDLVPRLWDGVYRGQTQKWFLMRFVGKDSDINLKTKVPEFSSWRWSSSSQLLDSIIPFKKKLYENILKEFTAFL